MRRQCILAGIVVFLSSSAAFAQPGEFGNGNEEEEIRAQIQALERKLNQRRKVEHSKFEGSSDRVTEIGSGGPSRAWQPAPQEPLVVRIYDLSDLFAVAPAYYARQAADLDEDQLIFDRAQGAMGGGMGGMGGGFFAVRPETIPSKLPEPLRQLGNNQEGDSAGNLGAARTSLNDLLKSITQSISPESWKENGGRGTIARLGNNLMVSTTDRTHEQIDNLFTLFRKRWGSLRTVSVNAHWLWLTDEQIAAATGAKGGGFGKVTNEAWQALRDQARQFERGGYHATVTCYNGQTVSAVAGGQRRFVRKVSPLEMSSDKDGKSVFGYETQTGMVQDGAALQVTPLTTSGGKIVVLDLHTRVNRFEDADQDRPAARPAAKGAADGQSEIVSQLVAAVDRPRLNSYRLATTLRVPIDETVLIGGMSAAGEPQLGEPGLYLFIHLAVQELRDEEPAAKPEGGEKAEGGSQKAEGERESNAPPASDPGESEKE